MTDASGNSFTLINGGTINLDNVTTIDGASFFVNDGVTLTLPSVTSFSVADEFSADNFFRASGAGSVLDLSNLTSLSGSSEAFSYLFVEALDGGQVDLSAVSEITGPSGGSGNRRGIQVLADGTNSEVNLSALTSFTNDASAPDSRLTARNGGTVTANNLTTLDGVDITSDNSILSLLGLTTYEGNNIAQAINGGLLDLLSLDTLLGGALIVRADGTTSIVNAADITGLAEEELNGGTVNLI